MKINQLSALIVFALMIASTTAIILQLGEQSWKKCYRTEHSPDKTLQVKLGFFRRERLQCKLRFTVRIVGDNGEIQQDIHNKQHHCPALRQGEPLVIKHTNENINLDGFYEICLEVLQNPDPNQLIELFIGEKLNPIIYSHSEGTIPLVQSQELIDLDLTVQSIKRSLVKSQLYAKQSLEEGDKLQVKIQEMMWVNQFATLLQIIFLIVFGVGWIRLVSKIKNKQQH